ncbi:uncharacterized protein LOC143357115 [Halictus rubicundus]|uniref:uncharacterized protein LOC143357115 n=1 Tax=Halictus rubicundus TaxID=77578 RepID=UPI004036DB08
MEQALFEKHYTSYSKVLRAVGLMPFDRTMFAIVQRSTYIFLLCYCLYVQSVNLVHVEKTLANIVWMLSYVCAMTLFGLRYLSFLICGSVTKGVFIQIGNDIESVKDPVEADIFAKYTKQSEYLLTGYLVGTESANSVYGSYLCGLLEIASYRMDLAIQHSKKTDSVLINVQPALDMQRKALSFVSSFRYHSNIQGK